MWLFSAMLAKMVSVNNPIRLPAAFSANGHLQSPSLPLPYLPYRLRFSRCFFHSFPLPHPEKMKQGETMEPEAIAFRTSRRHSMDAFRQSVLSFRQRRRTNIPAPAPVPARELRPVYRCKRNPYSRTRFPVRGRYVAVRCKFGIVF